MKTLRMNVAKMRSILAGMAIAIIALTFACIACKNETPTPEIITKTVTVTFPAYSGNSNINFTPTYIPDGGWEEFSASEITYTVTANGEGVSKTYDGNIGFNIAISSASYSDGNYTFTQTFVANGKTVGSQVIKVEVAFSRFGGLMNSSGTVLDPQAIPSVTLTLSKTK